MNEKYFQEQDKRLAQSAKRESRIVLLLAVLMAISGAYILYLNNSTSTQNAHEFEKGLDISYDASAIHVAFTNPNLDTSSTLIKIYIGYDAQNPTVVYQNTFTEFPAKIDYIPYDKQQIFTVIVTLTKSTGDYSYMKSITPTAFVTQSLNPFNVK